MADETPLYIEYIPLDQLLAHPRNPKLHNIPKLHTSFKDFGFVDPPLIDERTGYLTVGHGRLEGLQALRQQGKNPPRRIQVNDAGEWCVPVIRGVRFDSDSQAAAYLVTDNQLTTEGGWDESKLSSLIKHLKAEDESLLPATGLSDETLKALLARSEDETTGGGAGDGGGVRSSDGSLSASFLIPPFSVLDARQGYWQERKQRWLSLGIQSEVGRGDNLLNYDVQVTAENMSYYRKGGKDNPRVGIGQPTGRKKQLLGGSAMDGSWTRKTFGEHVTAFGATSKGTSIFDPVLCELVYRWFSPAGANILDPFAGGSVRGVVAHTLGRHYTGVDLSETQVRANYDQAAEILPDNPPVWHIGDSADITNIAPGQYDLIFSCPPYADLEVYSDDPADISNKPYDQFVTAYRAIISAACSMLNNNRFACFVVGDVRDKRGNYRNFVGDTVQAFLDAGLKLYNEAVLITVAGSLPIRARGQFEKARKLGKSHQNVLVFLKGDAKAAVKYCGIVETYWPGDETGEGGEYGDELTLADLPDV